MNELTRSEVATQLLDAYQSGKPIAPLTATYDDLTLEDAYAIQLLQIDAFARAGRSVTGHKVGLTSVAMQRLLGVDQPDYGHLLDDFFYLEHAPIPISRFIQPRVEPEVAFVLKAPAPGARGHGPRGDRRRRLRPPGVGDRRQPDRGLEDRAARHDRRQRELRRCRPGVDALGARRRSTCGWRAP